MIPRLQALGYLGVFASKVRNPLHVDLLESGAIREVSSYRAGVLDKVRVHHIASNKSKEFRPLFRKLFEGAKMSLEHPLNKLSITGHMGPHGYAYNATILDRLTQAVQGIDPLVHPALYGERFRRELQLLAHDLAEHGSELNSFVRFPG
jgi:hypothetical protein